MVTSPREMRDEEAYMALVLCNTQGELHPLEEGMHALRSGMTQEQYAEHIGKPRSTPQDRINAARVAEVLTDIRQTEAQSHRCGAVV